jgi:hypothetical protein
MQKITFGELVHLKLDPVLRSTWLHSESHTFNRALNFLNFLFNTNTNIKTYQMKKTLTIITALLISGAAFTQGLNLNGSWKLNSEKSKLNA